MHTEDSSRWKHSHDFAGESSAAEKNTRRVLALTAVMMVAEIVGGLKYRSMALFADGWHMGTHVAAFAITAIAYWFARRNAANERFSFGTGKIGVLGAFTSAVILGGVAVYMAGESALRLFAPEPIAFAQAIPIAAVGLLVNVVSALLLKHDHHGHGHGHEHHGHEHGHPHAGDCGHSHASHDLNLKAAYIHVIADAVTSVLAIGALLLGKTFGWMWLDPAMGLVGSAVIAQWALSLIRDTHVILLDCEPASSDLRFEIRKAIEGVEGTLIVDLHIWQVGADQFSAIVSVVTHDPQPPHFYKSLLSEHEELLHLTVEVNRCEEAAGSSANERLVAL